MQVTSLASPPAGPPDGARKRRGLDDFGCTDLHKRPRSDGAREETMTPAAVRLTACNSDSMSRVRSAQPPASFDVRESFATSAAQPEAAIDPLRPHGAASHMAVDGEHTRLVLSSSISRPTPGPLDAAGSRAVPSLKAAWGPECASCTKPCTIPSAPVGDGAAIPSHESATRAVAAAKPDATLESDAATVPEAASAAEAASIAHPTSVAKKAALPDTGSGPEAASSPVEATVAIDACLAPAADCSASSLPGVTSALQASFVPEAVSVAEAIFAPEASAVPEAASTDEASALPEAAAGVAAASAFETAAVVDEAARLAAPAGDDVGSSSEDHAPGATGRQFSLSSEERSVGFAAEAGRCNFSHCSGTVAPGDGHIGGAAVDHGGGLVPGRDHGGGVDAGADGIPEIGAGVGAEGVIGVHSSAGGSALPSSHAEGATSGIGGEESPGDAVAAGSRGGGRRGGGRRGGRSGTRGGRGGSRGRGRGAGRTASTAGGRQHNGGTCSSTASTSTLPPPLPGPKPGPYTRTGFVEPPLPTAASTLPKEGNGSASTAAALPGWGRAREHKPPASNYGRVLPLLSDRPFPQYALQEFWEEVTKMRHDLLEGHTKPEGSPDHIPGGSLVVGAPHPVKPESPPTLPSGRIHEPLVAGVKSEPEEMNEWRRKLASGLAALLALREDSVDQGAEQLSYQVSRALVEEIKSLEPLLVVRRRTKADLVRHNLGRLAETIGISLRRSLELAFGRLCMRSTAALKLDDPLQKGAVPLCRALWQTMRCGVYRDYQVMTKQTFNELIGQKRLWVAGEREALLEDLCTRDGRTWITRDYFIQHTSKNAGELYILVYMPRMSIVALAAVADFQTPWTAGQFHHMSHSCQEDRMFFFGRRSEAKETPKVVYNSGASFEGETRWTSHFHMPTLLSVDIICARPGVRGLAVLLLSHIACLQSNFLSDRTHLLFDISGRESNTRMVRFTQAIGAQRYQTFADESRSEGFIGVEGDDPSIYWTFKASSGFGLNQGKTAGVYALDVNTGTPINASHPAVLFDDRVTLQDFGKRGRNCSFFALSQIEQTQLKLIGLLELLRAAETPAAVPKVASAEQADAPGIGVSGFVREQDENGSAGRSYAAGTTGLSPGCCSDDPSGRNSTSDHDAYPSAATVESPGDGNCSSRISSEVSTGSCTTESHSH